MSPEQGGPPVTYRIEGLEHLQAILGQDWKRVIQAVAVSVAEQVRLLLTAEPARSSGPVVWASERQRRWWFATRREAGLPDFWTRDSDASGQSEKLIASWATRTEGDTSAVTGTRVSYAPYVQADAANGGIRQQPMHHYTGWPTDAQAVAMVRASGEIQRTMQQAVEEALKG